MSKQASLLRVVSKLIWIVGLFVVGFVFGVVTERARVIGCVEGCVEEAKQVILKRYEVDRFELRDDIDFVLSGSDSAKRAAVRKEVEWLSRYVMERLK